jgi:hypothetical protein
MDLKETGCEDVERINLVPGKDQWRALVNIVMNTWDSIKSGEFLD